MFSYLVFSLSEYRLQCFKSAVRVVTRLIAALDKALPNAGIAATVPQKIKDYVNELSSEEFDIDKPFYGDFATCLQMTRSTSQGALIVITLGTTGYNLLSWWRLKP